MKVAFVIDYLVQFGGGERVLLDMLSLYPNSDVYTPVYLENTPSLAVFKEYSVKTSFINRLPFKKHYMYYLPLFPIAVETMDFRMYDLVISISSAWAKGIITSDETCHISYILTPTRFLWHNYHALMHDKKGLMKKILYKILHEMRKWDYQSAQRPDYLIADSSIVQKRIKRYYNRNAEIINSGINTDFFTPSDEEKGDFYLLASRIKSHKSIHTAVEAFAKMNKPLLVVGEGKIYPYLRKVWKDNIKFLGRVDDTVLRDLYRRARGVVFPSYEDFGLIPLESIACGTPVIALNKGGVKETMKDGVTGVLYNEDKIEDIIRAVKRFESMSFNKATLREGSLKYSNKNFKEKMKIFIEKSLNDFY